MPTNKKGYMKQYWKDNPEKYKEHLLNIKIRRCEKRFIKILDSMLERIDVYFYRQNKINGVECCKNAACRMGETNVCKSKEV